MAALTLRDVPGLHVGHATDTEGITGCTVVLALEGAVAGVDVRGSAPGTRETDLLRPTALVERIHAVCLAGGSAFGLATADGVMRWLAERGIGYATGAGPVPIVPAAILYDLSVGSAATPGTDDGYAACAAAAEGEGALEGSVGAGTGATVAKLAGPANAVKGGVGSTARRMPDGTLLGALAVTNAVGNVVARDGRVIAAPRGAAAAAEPPSAPFENTTLAVIGTDASLDRAQCRKLAELGHDALARCIVPVHTMYDGDVVFALATGTANVLATDAFMALGIAAVDVLSEAIERSVLLAERRGGVPRVTQPAP